MEKGNDISELLYGVHPVLRTCTNEVNSYLIKAKYRGPVGSMEEIRKLLRRPINEEYYEVISNQPYEYKGIVFSPGEVYSKSKILELLKND